MKSIQYNAALTVTSTIRGFSKERFNRELSLESVQQWRWYGNFVTFLN